MSIILQINPFEFFADKSGGALDEGYVWIGQANKDPRQFPVSAYYDEALTIPAPMPLRTQAGYIVRNNSPTFLYINGNYSVLVQNKQFETIYYVADFLAIGNDSAISTHDFYGKAITLVENVAEVRLLDATLYKNVRTQGYYTAGDNGTGTYYYDPTDTISIDNGGSVLVGLAGARWKLNPTLPVDIRQFGAKADDALSTGSDSTQAIINAIAYAKANKIGEIRAIGAYRITDTLVFDTGVYLQSLSLIGDGSTSRIRQTGAGKDAIQWSATQYLRDSYIKNIQIYCEAAAGHGINIKYGCTLCRFENVDVFALNPTKSCYYGVWSAIPLGQPQGCFDTVWSGGDLYITSGHTTYGIDFVTNGTTFNENTFERLRCNNGGTVQFMRFANIDHATYLESNKLNGINFEICKAGGLFCYNARCWDVDNLSFWDVGGAYTNHLVFFANSGGGLASVNNTLSRIRRNGDSLAANIRDIFLQEAIDTTLINCWTDPSNAPSYDWNSNRVAIVGGNLSGELNTVNCVYHNATHSCTAHAVFNGATAVAQEAFNIGSIVRTSTGLYRVTFVAPKPTAFYRVFVTTSTETACLAPQTANTAAFFDIRILRFDGVAVDMNSIQFCVFG